MTMPIDLVFVRHGQSETNLAHERSSAGDHRAFDIPEFRHRHSADIRLTPLGKRQMEIAGGWLRKRRQEPFDAFYAPMYIRSKESAARMGLPGARWKIHPDLHERYWGRMDRLTYEEMHREFADELERRRTDPWFWKPPGGESLSESLSRIMQFFNVLHWYHSDDAVVVATHGELMFAIRTYFHRLSTEEIRRLHNVPNGHKDKIYNGQVHWYTRRNPDTGELAKHFQWFLSACPNNFGLSPNEWVEIIRPTYTNDELLAQVEKTPCLIK
ncbi:MAG: histidine phosphatase family protein [Candidatus Uhrbacteria bacterium]